VGTYIDNESLKVPANYWVEEGGGGGHEEKNQKLHARSHPQQDSRPSNSPRAKLHTYCSKRSQPQDPA
jgi:hypothetical protein